MGDAHEVGVPVCSHVENPKAEGVDPKIRRILPRDAQDPATGALAVKVIRLYERRHPGCLSEYGVSP
jgi:hypothetical protein